METLPRRSQTTRAIQNLHDRPDRPDRTQFYPSDLGRLSRPGRLRSSVAFPYDRPGRLNMFFETTATIRTIWTIRSFLLSALEGNICDNG